MVVKLASLIYFRIFTLEDCQESCQVVQEPIAPTHGTEKYLVLKPNAAKH